MSRADDATLLEFERALQSLADALRECERLLSTVELPESLVHDETFQRLLWLLRVEQDDGTGEPGADGAEGGRPDLLH
jgi:hypothetical protein